MYLLLFEKKSSDCVIQYFFWVTTQQWCYKTLKTTLCDSPSFIAVLSLMNNHSYSRKCYNIEVLSIYIVPVEYYVK